MRVVSVIKNKFLNTKRVAKRDYYQSKKKKQWPFFVVLFLLLIIFLIYLLFFSPYCKINNFVIQIEDYPTLRYPRQEVGEAIKKIASEKYLFFIPKDSLIFFSTKKLEKFLKEDKRVEEFKIEKKAPDVLTINLKIFEPQAVLLDFDQKYYLINKNGNKIVEAISESGILSLIENRIEGKKFFALLIKFINAIAKNFDFQITKVEVYQDKGVEIIKATTSEKWGIYFDERGDIEERIGNLFLVIREKIKDRQDLSYIDLRFGNKIIYK